MEDGEHTSFPVAPSGARDTPAEVSSYLGMSLSCTVTVGGGMASTFLNEFCYFPDWGGGSSS